jgi:ubiquitin-like-conjugating enzyme ATG3
LIGYNENGQLLTEEEIFEDVMADYANKTVTIENHPHLGIKEASIHPCNHAKVMKKIIDTVQSNGGTPQVHQSLFVFLKFISSVVPTIEYDFTIDLELE